MLYNIRRVSECWLRIYNYFFPERFLSQNTPKKDVFLNRSFWKSVNSFIQFSKVLYTVRRVSECWFRIYNYFFVERFRSQNTPKMDILLNRSFLKSVNSFIPFSKVLFTVRRVSQCWFRIYNYIFVERFRSQNTPKMDILLKRSF